jgi:hypothetical protein
MEIQHGKEGMKDKMFNNSLGATAGCTHLFLKKSRGSSMGYTVLPGLEMFKLQVRMHAVATKASFRSNNTIPFILKLLLRRH